MVSARRGLGGPCSAFRYAQILSGTRSLQIHSSLSELLKLKLAQISKNKGQTREKHDAGVLACVYTGSLLASLLCIWTVMKTPHVLSYGVSGLAHQLHGTPNRVALVEKDTGQGRMQKTKREAPRLL